MMDFKIKKQERKEARFNLVLAKTISTYKYLGSFSSEHNSFLHGTLVLAEELCQV